MYKWRATICQIISDRGIENQKKLLGIENVILNFHLDTNFKYDKKFKKPQNWDIMMKFLKTIVGFKVRVDLYNYRM